MKWLTRFFISLISLLGFFAICILAIWLKPSLVLTDARVNKLFNQYAGEYFTKSPELLQLVLQPYGFTGKHLTLSAENFCLKEPEACFKRAHLELSFKIGGFTRVKIFEIGPIEILNETLTYKIVKTAPKKVIDKKSGSLTDHVAISDQVEVKDVVIDFPKFRIEKLPEVISGSASLDGKKLDQISLKLDASSNENLNARVLLHTAFAKDKENPFDATIHFNDHVQVNGELNGRVNWQELEGSIAGNLEIRKIIPWINTVAIHNLKIERHANHSQIDADIETKLDQTLSSNKSKSVMPKIKLDTIIRGKIAANENKGLINYQLNLGPTREKGMVLEALVGGKVPFPKGEEYRYGLDKVFLNFEIPVFANFVKSLRLTNYPVPSPFSALKGSISLKLNQADGTLQGNQIPISLNTNLDSTEQTFKTQSDAKVELSQKDERIKVNGFTKIESFKFTLPDLKVLEPAPVVKNDSRLMSSGDVSVLKTKPIAAKTKATPSEEEDDSSSRVDLNWKITTSPSGIRILHPIFKPYAPAEITWNVGEHPEGSIELKPFDIEYLKRGAHVKTLRFYQNAGDPNFHYEGKLVIKKTDYTIFVNIIQDGEKPKVLLSSSPPLQDSDIVSVLLFNQTTAELDSTDENNSVASTQSAVANRALGLFSILALSSTPIEAVNFNPSTGVYSARVKLANGLTATVGTDWDKSQEVALRKRLGKNFVLSTILQNDPDTNTETRKTLIEWFKRF